MATSVLALPVSVEQIAAAINQMSEVEQRRLLTLTPRLQQVVVKSSLRTQEQMAASVSLLQAELFALLGDQILSADTPF